MVAQEYLQKQDGSSDLIVKNRNETVKWILRRKLSFQLGQGFH